MKIGPYTTHPAADVAPLMPTHELDSLAESMRTEGQRLPIVLVDYTDPDTGEIAEVILDGRNRASALVAAQIPPSEWLMVKLPIADPYTFAANTRMRSHMTASQRAAMAAALMPGLQDERRGVKVRPGKAREIAAALCGVSETYVDRANTVRHKCESGEAAPELFAMLRDGEAGLAEVHECAEWPIAEQFDAMRLVASGWSLRETVVNTRKPEPADVDGFAKALAVWIAKRTARWSAEDLAKVPGLVRAVADEVAT